jgi:hypothetical protein
LRRPLETTAPSSGLISGRVNANAFDHGVLDVNANTGVSAHRPAYGQVQVQLRACLRAGWSDQIFGDGQCEYVERLCDLVGWGELRRFAR